MFRPCVPILFLICALKSLSAEAMDALQNDLTLTETFFQKLIKDYGSMPSGEDVTKILDEKIAEFVQKLNSPVHWRHKRHLEEHTPHSENGIGVLNGFSMLLEDPFPNALAISVFTQYNGVQLQWFVATLDASRTSLFSYNGNQFQELGFYPVAGGYRLIADCSEFGCVLVISENSGSVTVLRLETDAQENVLRPVQYLGGLKDVNFSIWHGMNQMFLGVASSANISIYHWLGEHFDSIQVLNYGTGKITPLKIGGSLYLVITGIRTTVLRFDLQLNMFVLAQKLPSALDVESFFMERGHQKEHYLVLTNQKSTIVYKFIRNHFVPFQSIAKADRISSITTKDTVVLLTLTGSLLNIYQYDGWKFVKLRITMSDVGEMYPTSLDGEIVLIVRHINGVWTFQKLIWAQQSNWHILKDEVKSWSLDTMEKAKRQPAVVPKLDGPIKLMQGHIGKLHTKRINGKDTEELIHLSDRLAELRLNLSAHEQLYSELMTRENPKFNTLYATNISGKCTLGCTINMLNSTATTPLLDKLARPDTLDQDLIFENVRARSTGSLRCPKPAVIVQNVTVSQNVNGLVFESLAEDLLRVTGDQEVTGEHTYLQLSASSALVPLEIAKRSTQLDLHARSIKANNLYLMQGGIFLPLNGSPVTINDTKIATNVKITGLVHLRGNLKGEGAKILAPMTWIEEPLLLLGNYSLQKVIVQNQASALDLILAGERSLTKILNESVRLDADVPVHLKLSKSKTIWTNITANVTENLIITSTDTERYSTVRIVTGSKRALNDLIIRNVSYEALPIPKFQRTMCASEASIDNIETWNVSVGQAIADTLKTEYLFGVSTLDAIITDTPTSTKNLSLSSKIFAGVVNVTHAMLDDIDGIDFQRLLTAMIGWREPGLVEGLVNVSNVIIKNLIVPNGFVPPRIAKARNLISTGNIYVDTLNKANIADLMDSVVKLDETISLTNVVFAGGLIAETVTTLLAPIDLSGTRNLGMKIIAGGLKCTNLILPYSFTYPSTNISATLIIKGSATFAREPRIKNINSRNLIEISNEMWFTDKPAVLYNRISVARRLVLEGPVYILGWFNSQNHGPWNQTSSILLSRTKPQQINTHVYLKIATVPNIVSEKMLNLSVPSTFLEGLGEYWLRKNISQTLVTDIRFEKLIILGDLRTSGKINRKNLSTDIVRSDVKENIIIGRKTVHSLHAENLNGGLNFSEWQRHSLSILNTEKPIFIKGFKTFTNIELRQPLRVDGMVQNHKMENYLLKSLPQEISGMKKINGVVNASHIIMNGLVNDVNLISLVQHQLKKNKQVQNIRTPILTKGDVAIMGNARMNSLYHGVELIDLDKLSSGLQSITDRMAELKHAATQIQTALSHKAWYWHKLELLEVNSTALISAPSESNIIPFEGLGSCSSKDGVLTCDNESVQFLIFTPNASRILFSQVFQLAGIPIVVVANSDPNGGVWIYNYENMEQKFRQIAGLNLPGATQASAVVTEGSLWLAVQLRSDTIILRYEVWGQFEEYTLPGSDLFLLEVAPTGELLIFRSDGVWRLGGLSGPRQLARAHLYGKISTYVVDGEYYVQLMRHNNARLLKSRFIGN